ncbi:hypothetical protein HUJ04_011882 [Dendroctonus ponderosae]|nr:hypothetical protein HUJ04_011878 [Dendroctonus ponderosae]KAH1022489.1 hypothetical protein HUJ04_011882 [Dendroctonus ponderosae]
MNSMSIGRMPPTPSPHSTDDLLPTLEEDKQGQRRLQMRIFPFSVKLFEITSRAASASSARDQNTQQKTFTKHLKNTLFNPEIPPLATKEDSTTSFQEDILPSTSKQYP